MSLYDYDVSELIELEALTRGWSFRAQVMACMRRADTDNLAALQAAFPGAWAELQARYKAPGGILPGEVCEGCHGVGKVKKPDREDGISLDARDWVTCAGCGGRGWNEGART